MIHKILLISLVMCRYFVKDTNSDSLEENWERNEVNLNYFRVLFIREVWANMGG
jgi:hypothetical protein